MTNQSMLALTGDLPVIAAHDLRTHPIGKSVERLMHPSAALRYAAYVPRLMGRGAYIDCEAITVR